MVDFLGRKTLCGGDPEIIASELEMFTTIVGFLTSKSWASVSHFDFRNLENLRGCFELGAIPPFVARDNSRYLEGVNILR